ncbi:MAG TPA: glycosyltransferase family 8 protein [Tepidisphaeraceae bacterium]|jgi:lipopolysaccharide biosynthesis glycosyltransferase|nr:glycosyltransferase family 8 protein [Tepidisphaeraceae bacterium]
MAQPPIQSRHEIALLCCGDDGYAMPLAVMLYSASVNLPPPWRLRVFLMDGGITPESRRLLEKKIAGFGNVDLEWRRISLDAFQELPILKRLNSTIYIRLLMDDVLPADLHRIIYLDGDLLVEGDLSQLWQEDFAGATVLAVRDYGSSVIRPELPLPGVDDSQRKDAPYFNSGVLMIDRSRWRADRVGQAVLDYVRQFKPLVRFPDQDGLNAVLLGKWRQLDLSWNAQVDNLICPEQLGNNSTDNEIRRRRDELLFHPRIQHYAGRKKPWNAGRFKPVRKRFIHYLHASRWLGPLDLAAFHIRWAYSTVRLALKVFGQKFTP